MADKKLEAKYRLARRTVSKIKNKVDELADMFDTYTEGYAHEVLSEAADLLDEAEIYFSERENTASREREPEPTMTFYDDTEQARITCLRVWNGYPDTQISVSGAFKDDKPGDNRCEVFYGLNDYDELVKWLEQLYAPRTISVAYGL